MVSPIIPDLAVAPLRAMQEKGLRHRATVRRSVTVTHPNDEEERFVDVVETDVPVLLVPLGPRDGELAAARGIQAAWVVKARLGTDLRLGDELTITARIKGVEVEYQVRLTGDLASPGRVIRRLGAVDSELS